MLPQVGWVPRQVEVRPEEKTEVAERDEPHVGREENFLPGSDWPRDAEGFDRSVRVHAADARQLGAIHSFMLLGKVAVEKAEHQRPEDAERPEDVENRAPAESEQYASGNERRDGHGEAAEEMRGALDAPALDARKPQLHAPAGHREGSGLAEAQEEARPEQRREAEGRARHDGCRRPKRHDDGQHALRTEAIAKPA